MNEVAGIIFYFLLWQHSYPNFFDKIVISYNKAHLQYTIVLTT